MKAENRSRSARPPLETHHRRFCLSGLLLLGVAPAAAQPTEIKLLAEDGRQRDAFGSAVAMSGDTLLVGARGRHEASRASQGAAYIFTRSGETWKQHAKLLASDPAAYDNFGFSCDLSGDTALVGAYMKKGDAGARQGAVYVFTRTSTDWAQQAKLLAADAIPNSHFGISVALSGDTAVVGACGAGECSVDGPPPAGAVYVFKRTGERWTQEAKLQPSRPPDPDDAFGNGVALDADTLIVGAVHEDAGSRPDQGAAYIFVRKGRAWTQQARLVAKDAGAEDSFGRAVAIVGDIAVVSAYMKAGRTGRGEGAVYIFRRSGETWTQEAKIGNPDPAEMAEFGWAVAVQGGTVAIAHPGRSAIHLYTRSEATWSRQVTLTSSDGKRDGLGSSVAVSGQVVLAGSSFNDGPGGQDQGAAFVFTSSAATGWKTSP